MSSTNLNKICSRCGERKRLELFHISRMGRYGRSSICAECRRIEDRNRREKTFKEKPWIRNMNSILHRCIYGKKNKSNKKYYMDRNIKVNISESELKEIWFRNKAYLMKKPQIDRIDSSMDYSYNNCRFLPASYHASLTNNKRVIETINKGKPYLKRKKESTHANK